MDDLKQLTQPEYFRPWDKQIRLFAGYFLAHVLLPSGKPFKLLDVGCGTGSAMAEIRKRYPHGDLHGCDILDYVAELAASIHPSVGRFFASDILSLRGEYDCIYVSNVLEHVPDWRECLAHLCALAPQVAVMVPYREDLSLQTSSGLERVDHVASFDDDSMSLFEQSGFKVERRVIRTPFAWGGPRRRELIFRFKAALRGVHYEDRREILYLISRHEHIEKTRADLRMRFRSRPLAFLQTLPVHRQVSAEVGI